MSILAKRLPKCPVCKTDNPDNGFICSACGAFLTDRKDLDRLINVSAKKWSPTTCKPTIVTEHPLLKTTRPVYPTCSLYLDALFGCGGVPLGARIEVYGGEATGKTSLGFQIVAEFQRHNASVLWIDIEHYTLLATTLQYAQRLGVNLETLYISFPLNGTEAIELIGDSAGLFDLVVLDSVAMLGRVGYVNKEASVEKGNIKEVIDVAGPARILADFQQRIQGKVAQAGTTVLLLNQARDIIPTTGGKSYGGIRSPGGKVLRHVCTHRFQLTRIGGKSGTIKEDGEPTGFKVRAKVIKSRTSHEGAIAELDFLWDRGFSRDREYLQIALESGILKREGSWIKDADGNTLAQGIAQLKIYYDEHPEALQALKTKVEQAVVGMTSKEEIKPGEGDDIDEEGVEE